MKTTTEYIRLLRDYKRDHAVKYGIERMGIFGSVARGEQAEDSDVDVYFESPSMSLFKMGGLMCELEDLFGTRVDLVHKHKNLQQPFLHRIEKDMIYV
jgi:predicted nucleotidyltransferase